MEKNKLNFISEIASTHNGNPDVICKIINKHLETNSDYIKIQILKAENIHKKNTKLFNRYKEIEIDFSVWNNIISQYWKKTKLIIEPFDNDSYLFAKKYKNKLDLKISSSESDNFQIIKDANKNFRKVFINLSGYNHNQIILFLKKHLDYKKNIIMYGFQSYPTKSENINFSNFELFNKYNFISGYADHTDFNNKKELYDNSILAICKGAKYIEKHICINRKNKPPDYISSLEKNELIKYINDLEKFYKLLSKNNFTTKEEINYAKTMHKFFISSRDIKKGEKLTEKNGLFLRNKKSNTISRIDIKMYKFYAKFDIKKNQLVLKNHVEKK